MAPVTRSLTHSSDSLADVHPPHGPMVVLKMTVRLSWNLTEPADTDPVHGKDAKALRYAPVQSNSEVRELELTIAAYCDTDGVLVRSIRSYGYSVGLDTFVRLCLKIGSVLNTANPPLETIAKKEVFKHVDEYSLTYKIMNKVYGANRNHLSDNGVACAKDTIRSRQIALTDDQSEALGLGSCGRSIVTIQASFEMVKRY
ncbi:hypothetical protein Aduo_014847 [Ancylostoma duodenale]